MRFWDKAGKVLAYKQQTLVAARKKVVYDKHLDFLVGQTQRYSSLLAERLAAAAAGEEGSPSAGGSPAPPALPAPEARYVSASIQSPRAVVYNAHFQTIRHLLRGQNPMQFAMAVQELPAAVASEAAPSQSMAEHDPPRLLAGASAATAASAAPVTNDGAPAAAGAADADGEWVGGVADDEADDEGTLEEEEVPPSSTCVHTCHARDRQI